MAYLSNKIGAELSPIEEIILAQIADLGMPLQYLRVNILGTGLEYATLPSPGGIPAAPADAIQYNSNPDGTFTADACFTRNQTGNFGVQLFSKDNAGNFTAVIVGDITGNDRGVGALDLQSARSAPTQVASGAHSSTIGQYNTVSGYNSIGVGFLNTVAGNFSTGSGYSNTASDYGTTASGYTNIASAFKASAMGANNIASGCLSSSAGFCNTACGLHDSAHGVGNIAGGLVIVTPFNPTAPFGAGTPNPPTDAGQFHILTAGDSTVQASTNNADFNVDSISESTVIKTITNSVPNDAGSGNTSFDIDSAFNSYSTTGLVASFGLTITIIDAGLTPTAGTMHVMMSDADYVTAGFSDGNSFSFNGFNNTPSGPFSLTLDTGNPPFFDGTYTVYTFTNQVFGTLNATLNYTYAQPEISHQALEASAHGVCNTASGDYSSAFGRCNFANSACASAFGYLNFAVCPGATALGFCTSASSVQSTAVGAISCATSAGSSAFGFTNYASNSCSAALGSLNCAAGAASSALGVRNNACGTTSTASGYYNTTGNSSSAFGYFNVVPGTRSTASGYRNCVCTDDSHAFGGSNSTLCASSTAVGNSNATCGTYANAFGFSNIVIANCGIAVGYQNTASTYCAASVIGICNFATGNNASSFGIQNCAVDQASAFGYQNCACGADSTAFGYANLSTCTFSHAFGNSNTSSGYCSLAVGGVNTATGLTSSAVGYQNTASCPSGSAMGYLNNASGGYSAAFGYCTSAGERASAFGHCSSASALSSFASGFKSSANGTFATASGSYNSANCCRDTAVGFNNSVSGYQSSAFGYGNIITDCQSAAFGYNNTVSIFGATVLGTCITNSTCNSVEIGPADAAKVRVITTPLTNNAPVFTDGFNSFVSGTNAQMVLYGIPVIVASADLLAQTTTVTVASITSPNDAANHTYAIGSYVNITAITPGDTLIMQVDFTDENAALQTVFLSVSLAVTGFTADSTVNIRVAPNTAVTVTATVVAAAMAFDVGATIQQMN